MIFYDKKTLFRMVFERNKRHILCRISWQGVGTSTSNSSSGTSATSDDDHDSDVLMANNTISVCINKRHKTYMQACCADGICFGKFKDIETRILEVDPQPLFSNIHINENGSFRTQCPTNQKVV